MIINNSIFNYFCTKDIKKNGQNKFIFTYKHIYSARKEEKNIILFSFDWWQMSNGSKETRQLFTVFCFFFCFSSWNIVYGSVFWSIAIRLLQEIRWRDVNNLKFLIFDYIGFNLLFLLAKHFLKTKTSKCHTDCHRLTIRFYV